MFEKLQRFSPSSRIDLEHSAQEASEASSFSRTVFVFFFQDGLEGPEPQLVYVSQLALAVEDSGGVCAREAKVFREVAEELDDLGDMVVVLGEALALLGVEQVVASA